MSLRPHICTLYLTKTTRWEVVKNSASPKRPFFFNFFFISCHFSHFQSFSSPNPRQTYLSYNFFATNFSISFLFLKTTPTSNPKGGAHSTCMFIFLLGHAHIWPKKGACAYVDDVCTALKVDSIEEFHHHINSVEETIQFTIEEESDGKLSFLDTEIIHHDDVSLTTKVYRKTHTDKYLSFKSHHPLVHKKL